MLRDPSTNENVGQSVSDETIIKEVRHLFEVPGSVQINGGRGAVLKLRATVPFRPDSKEDKTLGELTAPDFLSVNAAQSSFLRHDEDERDVVDGLEDTQVGGNVLQQVERKNGVAAVSIPEPKGIQAADHRHRFVQRT